MHATAGRSTRLRSHTHAGLLWHCSPVIGTHRHPFFLAGHRAMMGIRISRELLRRWERMGKQLLLASVVLVALSAAAGCNLLKQITASGEKPVNTDKEPALALPTKHSLRVAQFLFLADFKLHEDHA